MILKKVDLFFTNLITEDNNNENKMNKLVSHFLLASKKNTRLTFSAETDSFSLEIILRMRKVIFLFFTILCKANSLDSGAVNDDRKATELKTTAGRITNNNTAIAQQQ